MAVSVTCTPLPACLTASLLCYLLFVFMCIIVFFYFSVLQVSPRNEGLLNVVVYDLCLDSPHPATLSIQVSDIHSVEVTVANKV